MNLTLIYPMFAQFLLTFAVLVVMFMTRVNAIRSGRMPIKYFRTYSPDLTPPDDVIKTQRHFTNLFETPVLFFAGCLAAAIIPVYGFMILFWAWLYVAARIVHAIIHIGPNRIRPRMLSYAVGWIALLGLWFTVAMKLFFLSANAL